MNSSYWKRWKEGEDESLTLEKADSFDESLMTGDRAS
jgi:hypothetical protein